MDLLFPPLAVGLNSQKNEFAPLGANSVEEQILSIYSLLYFKELPYPE